MPELLEDATVEAIRIRAKWENDDYICRGHILNGMSDSLFDVYTNVESAKECWIHLNLKYMARILQLQLTTDRGVNIMIPGFFQSVAIIHETTAPYTPQQKGPYKRHTGVRNENLGEKGLIASMLDMAEKSHSKAYRPKDIYTNVQESQMDDHTDDVPNEIPEPRRGKRAKKAKSYGSDFQLYLIVVSFSSYSQYSDPSNGCQNIILNGDLDEDVYMKQPEGFVIPDCSPVSTPIDPVKKLKPNIGKPVNQLEYSRAIGCLMYAMTSTRPDIAYAVGRLNSSSTSGWVFLLGGGAISWASKKQTCITGSAMGSEFVALTAAGKEA
ncbi:hypothetical protein Tco_0092359 [Tanacetum coccineum]